ncbi:MAG: alpha/beta hydrolase [Rikenellaceae bacterium]|nr:alpha/beta hydrolase [Rikenellaceae bacterium]MBR3801044.1 alpha/beta hydrolase [Rikenellaceae bacterium]
MKRIIIAIVLALMAVVASASVPVTLSTDTGEIHGTLSVPDNASRTAVLIIAGSGPTDRNGNSSVTGIATNAYKMLADSLAARGYASLRYDKRGIAASATAGADESQLTFEAYIDDAAAWAEWLAADERFDRVVLAGHSEGGLIALVAAKRSDKVAGVITLAGVGESIDATLRRQLGTQPEPYRTECMRIIDELKAGRTVSDPMPELAALFRPSVQPFLISQMRYEPSNEARTLTQPLLVVQGTTDIQINLNDAIKLSTVNPRTRLAIVSEMNHVLKICASLDQQAQMMTYINDTLPLAPTLVATIVDFLSKLN